MTTEMKGPIPLSEIVSPAMLTKLKRQASGPTPMQRRLFDAAGADATDTQTLLYQHTVFCQVYFPYRDPGPSVVSWDRSNGLVDFRLKAGEAKTADGQWVDVPLPFGPKCRLVLMHLNQRAIIEQSHEIEIEDSLTAFVRRVLRLDTGGRTMNMVKEQLSRLSTSTIRLGLADAEQGTAVTGKLDIVKGFDIWQPKDDRQRVLWPSIVRLSLDYFESLLKHAVPLNEGHISALSHSSMALDIYAWLAQRLHRIPPNKPAFVSWAALHSQFGQGYNPKRMDKFRAVFGVALREVLSVYAGARITEDERRPPRLYSQGGPPVWKEAPARGLTLHHSVPPVPKLLHSVP